MGLRLGVSSAQRAAEDRIDEELSSLIRQVTNEITWHMREHGLTRADLAGRMGVSPGRVSQILSGGENLTLRTLAGLANALDGRFEVGFGPRAAQPGTSGVSQELSIASDAEGDERELLPLADHFEEVRQSTVATRG
jgi:transcriptional regulator with XRE-family HTH domain